MPGSSNAGRATAGRFRICAAYRRRTRRRAAENRSGFCFSSITIMSVTRLFGQAQACRVKKRRTGFSLGMTWERARSPKSRPSESEPSSRPLTSPLLYGNGRSVMDRIRCELVTHGCLGSLLWRIGLLLAIEKIQQDLINVQFLILNAPFSIQGQ